jgi:hypothetical protein
MLSDRKREYETIVQTTIDSITDILKNLTENNQCVFQVIKPEHVNKHTFICDYLSNKDFFLYAINNKNNFLVSLKIENDKVYVETYIDVYGNAGQLGKVKVDSMPSKTSLLSLYRNTTIEILFKIEDLLIEKIGWKKIYHHQNGFTLPEDKNNDN